jgi:hypothetical protein
MTINYQLGNLDVGGAAIRAQAVSLEAEHHAIVRNAAAARDFRGGGGEVGMAVRREFKARGGNTASNYGGYFKPTHSARS